MEPWGTPQVTFLNEDASLPGSTICDQLERYNLNQSFATDLTP